jgi:predicted ribonuclease YlaK
MVKFYDTSSLLKIGDKLFDEGERFAISSVTLDELENIKTCSIKDADVKYSARKLLRDMDAHMSDFDIVMFSDRMLKPINKLNLSITNDIKILSCAINYAKTNSVEVEFVTNDIILKVIARMFFSKVSSIKKDEHDDYTGYLDMHLTDEQMNDLYSNPEKNIFNLKVNQYFIVRNSAGEVVDRLVWTGEKYRNIQFNSFNSKWFGEVKPLHGDIYQQLAFDSLCNNKITMIKGPAGTGKTYIALGYLLHKLDRGKIDKIIIFCNTVATKNSAKLGFYPGTRDEKLLDSQIGNLLSSKLGGRIEVERMIADEQIILLPLSDIRGYDTSGMSAGIYISEAQNLDISLMKLALQRIGEDSICIIDGDAKTQVDDINFAGANNGMRRASKVFRDTDVYGEVELKNIHRSKIARIAERM